MPGGVSKISRRYKPVGAELFLETEIPLGNPHVGTVIVHGRYDGERRPRYIFAQISSERQRQWISAGKVRPRSFKLHIGQREPRCPWWHRGQASLVDRGRIVVERPHGNPDRRAAIPCQIPCQSHARGKILPLAVHARSAWESGIRVKVHARRRIKEPIGLDALP